MSPKLTKLDAVRLALDAGHDNTKEAIPWIKDEFQLDVPEATFNSYQSSIKSGTKAKKEESFESLHEQLRKGNLDIADAMMTVRELVTLFGAETMKRLVDVFDV